MSIYTLIRYMMTIIDSFYTLEIIIVVLIFKNNIF